jgi:hypothetical protein
MFLFFEVTSGNIGQVFNYTGDLVNSFKPLIFLIGGFLIANFIISYIVNLVRDRLIEREEARRIEREKLEYIGKRVRRRFEKRRAEVELPEIKEA